MYEGLVSPVDCPCCGARITQALVIQGSLICPACRGSFSVEHADVSFTPPSHGPELVNSVQCQDCQQDLRHPSATLALEKQNHVPKMKSIFRFIVAILGGLILGNLLIIPLGGMLDLIYGRIVTGGAVPISIPNIIYIISYGLSSGFIAGRINKKRGILLGVILGAWEILFIVPILILSIPVTKELNLMIVWSCIKILPCIVGGYAGEKSVINNWRLKRIVGGWLMVSAHLVAGILALVLHVWTIVIAFLSAGLFEAVITLICPVISQIYWFVKAWQITGTVLNLYCLAILAYIGCCVILLAGIKLIGESE